MPKAIAKEPDCFELRSHGGTTPDDTTPYEIISGEHLETYYFDVPYAAPVQAIAFDALVDHPEKVKRMFLYDASRAPQPAGSHGFEVSHLDAEILYMWASGFDVYEAPEKVGLHMAPPGGTLALEIHYWNTGERVNDRSGLRVCTTSTPREHEASMLVLGTEQIALGGTETTVEGQCSIGASTKQNAVLVSVLPHMHFAGRRAKLSLAPAGEPANARVLFDSPFDFASHEYLELSAPLSAGDTLLSECMYDVSGAHPIMRGEGLLNEECLFYLFSYPGDAWTERSFAVSGITNACLGAVEAQP